VAGVDDLLRARLLGNSRSDDAFVGPVVQVFSGGQLLEGPRIATGARPAQDGLRTRDQFERCRVAQAAIRLHVQESRKQCDADGDSGDSGENPGPATDVLGARCLLFGEVLLNLRFLFGILRLALGLFEAGQPRSFRLAYLLVLRSTTGF
jgi:hypothetical protein